ncbi:hypothetical protein [Pseudomonas sp. S1(2024)]|uniref:hypothetical protein n=1 Tax=Pseudomonas sp. S1(2024) TaxID=3390191 RepID=UPI00397CCCED
MKLTQLFCTVPHEQFKPSSQKGQQAFLEAVNLALGEVAPINTSFDSLVALHQQESAALATVIQALNSQGHAWMEATHRLDFQAAWVLDGGQLSDIVNLMQVTDKEYVRNLAEDCINLGAHHPLLLIGFKDSNLSLAGAGKILTSLFHPSGDCFKTVEALGTDIDRLTLGAFEHAPELKDKPDMASALYLNQFHPGTQRPVGAVDLSLLACSVYHGFLEDPSSVDYAVRRTLNVLVYTPHLQLKARGVGTMEIAQSAQCVMDAIEAYIGVRLRIAEVEAKAFNTAALANLFSPFPKDVALLGISDYALHGQPGFEGLPRGQLAITLEGPLGSFSGTDDHNSMGVIAEGWENAGYQVDLNKALFSLLQEHESFPTLVKYKETCEFLEGCLRRIVADGPVDDELTQFLSNHISLLNFEKLPAESQIGYLGIRVHDFLAGRWWDDDSQPEKNMSSQLKKHPALIPDFLSYLDRHGQLDAQVLAFAKLGAGVLDELGARASDRLKEDYLAQDLGL